MIKNVIIYLIGFAGTGKLTIAKEIASKSNIRIVANHLINDPILSVIQADGKTPLPRAVWDKIGIIRDVVFDTITNISPSNYSFIFTNELIEGNDIDLNVYNKVEAIATKRGSKYLPVRLICEAEELCKRVVSEERKANFKMIDKNASLQQSLESTVLNPKHPNTFTLDVTNLSAKEAADVILAKLASIITP